MSANPDDLAGAPTIDELVGNERYGERGQPHAEWTWLRRRDPVRWFEGNAHYDGFWAITRHADIVAIGKDPERFVVGPRLAVFDREFPPPAEVTRHLLTMDPPEHAQYRRLASKGFTPRAVKKWQPEIDRITREVLNRAAAKRELDFVAEVSAPITIAVIGLMLGVPEADWPLLFRWTNEAVAPQELEHRRGRGVRETGDEARRELFRYFAALADERRARPRDDVVSVLANARIDGEPLSTLELLSYTFLLVIAGNETTRNAMTGGLHALCDHPAECAKLCADPRWVDGMVEETVRWVTPVNQLTRTATRDALIRGRTIRRGESVCLFYASGNRDEEVFPEPFRFDLTRRPNHHIGFGRGEHVCLGAHLARLELRTLFAQLRERLVGVERARPAERMSSSFVSGVKRSWIRWELREAPRP